MGKPKGLVGLIDGGEREFSEVSVADFLQTMKEINPSLFRALDGGETEKRPGYCCN